MRKKQLKLRTELTQDKLVSELRSTFEHIEDKRAKNVVHQLADVLMSAYAIFALKYPSVLSFEQQTKSEQHNLTSMFGIKQLVSDAQMRRILDSLDLKGVDRILASRFNWLERLGLKQEYYFLKKYLVVPVDGVHYFSSNKIKCEKCCVQMSSNGSTTYSHSMLGAVLVHPYKKEVFPLACEPIVKQDGQKKNDCEQNAAKRLINSLSQRFKEESLLLVEDALYANTPHIKQILAHNWDYLISVKPGSHGSLYRYFEARLDRKQVQKWSIRDGKHTHRFSWINNVPLNQGSDIRCNFLYYEQEDHKGKIQRFSWVTSLKIRKTNVFEIMRTARARWKIENETFNTLKNQGYHFEHNYGHGHNNLSSILAILMLIAFFIDQLMLACSALLNNIYKKAKSKKKVFHTIRALFSIAQLDSFQQLLQQLANQYEVLLE